ncbi:MAG TPA: SusC/RagA family protein [Bacteroidales bacterium]|nr:SusC/RagA family protein [Bacteroidales bacterium]
MKKIPIFLILLIVSFGIFAQNITVEGVITTSTDGQALPGATIIEKGTSNGTITNIEGYYKITVSSEAVLQFSFVGMETQEITVAGQSKIDISMETATTDLDEVIVIGYGSVKKKDITGAVSMLDNKTIEDLKPAKIEQALQGTMAGVNVTSQSGSPGADLDIRIRGISTNGDASPVVIIDGYQGDLNTLNPSDIESITVLKDAQAAIYGTVGANGIILVTTKKGTKNTAPIVNINSSYGIQETTRKLPVLNATEYAVLLNESYAASGDELPYPDISSLGTGTNWQNELFSTAPTWNTDISLSAGTESIVYALSVSDFGQEGIIGGNKSGFDRNTARLSLGADFTDWLKFNSSLTYTHIDRKTFNDFELGSVLFNALNMPPTVPVYDTDGEYFYAPGNVGIEIINPLQQLANTFNDYNLNKWNGNFGLDAEIIEHLTATARIGFNTTNTDFKEFRKIVDYGGKVFDVSRSSVLQKNENFNDYTFDAFITYDNIFFDAHHITGTIGTTVYKTWGDELEATGFDVPNNSWDFADISLADGLNTAKATGSYTYDQRRLSYFARVQYDYKAKYLLSAMLRRDASTKFGPDNSVAYFPSVTAGWIVSDESFMNSLEIIDRAKLRVSYGILGSDKINDYQYISQLSGEGTYVINGVLVTGTAIGALPNPSVKWEESEQFDVGLDIKLLQNRIDINADYFIKTTENLLIGNIPVSGILGVSAPGASGPTVNAGTVRNKGFEFAIAYRGNISKGLSYSINYNLTTLDNEVLEVNNGSGFVEGGVFGVGQPSPLRMEVGLPIGYFYGYETDGIFQTQAEVDAHPSQAALGSEASPGDIRYKNTNDDNVIDSDDRTYIGDPIPDYIMGLNFTLKYKGFDFVAYAYASIGNEIVRNYERTQPNVNKLSYTLDRWTGEGTSNSVPRVTTEATSNNVFSDYYVEDGSFVRLQNIQLGYTIPERITQKVKADKVRIYVSANNLFTLTNYTGYDPAASSGEPIGGGIDKGFYPAARIYTFGLNLTF